MSRHKEMPPVPPANRSHKGTGDNAEISKEMAKTKAGVNAAEQGDTQYQAEHHECRFLQETASEVTPN